MDLKGSRESANQRGTFVNLVKLWRDFEVEDNHNGANGMVRLAMRILSMVPNSASTERILSRFGSIHTKARSRLHVQKVRKMTIVSQDIERVYGTGPSRYTKQTANEANVTTPLVPHSQIAGDAAGEEDEIAHALRNLDLQSSSEDDTSAENSEDSVME
ncbi:hypothetical protein K435DRAFT_929989, partial [Dendrothele bispora CBS 962.96]